MVRLVNLADVHDLAHRIVLEAVQRLVDRGTIPEGPERPPLELLCAEMLESPEFDTGFDRPEDATHLLTLYPTSASYHLYRKEWLRLNRDKKAREALAAAMDGIDAGRTDEALTDLGADLHALEGDSLIDCFDLDDAGDYLEEEPPKPDPILAGFCDRGDKIFTYGSSKSLKSWHAQQTLMLLAAGLPIFGLYPERPMRVLYCNYEIQPHHLHRRLNSLGHGLGVTRGDLNGRFQVFNARGNPPPLSILRQPFDLICLDPLYKVLAALGRDEMDPRDLGVTLGEIDAHLRHGSAAAWIVHHNPKGESGDRRIVDRGAGSGKLGRDLDAMFSLGRHRDDENAVVLEYLTRNYETPEPVVMRFREGCLVEDPDLDPVLATSLSEANRRNQASAIPIEEIAEKVGRTLTTPRKTEDLKKAIRSKYKIGWRKIDDVLMELCEMGFSRWKSRTFPAVGMIGPEDQDPAIQGEEWTPE